MQLCVIVPSFNHGASAEILVRRLEEFGLPLIIVNDASIAEDAAILHELATIYSWIEVIDHDKNGGKGAAVMTGLKVAYKRGFSHALQIDADGQHDPNDVPRFIEAAKKYQNAVITGQPIYNSSVPKGRLIGRYATHIWVWIETLSFVIRDSMCGFRVYPLMETIEVLSSVRLGMRMDFDPEILVRLYWAGTPVQSLPTAVIYPPDGTSHFRMWADNWLITQMHTRLVFGMLLRSPRLIWQKFK